MRQREQLHHVWIPSVFAYRQIKGLFAVQRATAGLISCSLDLMSPNDSFSHHVYRNSWALETRGYYTVISFHPSSYYHTSVMNDNTMTDGMILYTV